MNINNITIANTLKHLKNPNVQTGTLLIELPADVGRAYSGYKRGGIIEGAEKFRKEVMSAAVWLFGIPFFNFLGTAFCENILKIPMDIDYSGTNGGISTFKEIFGQLKNNKAIDEKNIISKGRDSIKDSVEFLTTGANPNGLDTSELVKKYGDKFKGADPNKLIKQIKGAKQITSIAALVINCALMGVILPKLNQKITAKKLKEQENKKQAETTKYYSMDEFKKETNKDISFKGFGGFASALGDYVTYGVNNSNRFRLISTDVPMIIGRTATARNKYEALEIALMDSAAIYFYNFCLGHCEKLLRKINPTPNVNSGVAEYISKLDENIIRKAIENLPKDGSIPEIKELFDEDIQKIIYKEATYGKYGKINRFVQNDELKEIDKSVAELLKHFSAQEILEGKKVDFVKLVKKFNIKNTAFFAIGTIASFLGLGILIPKVAYFITKKITGKDGFVGIQEENKK